MSCQLCELPVTEESLVVIVWKRRAMYVCAACAENVARGIRREQRLEATMLQRPR